MGTRIANYVLAALSFTGHVSLTILLLRRKLAGRLPLFTLLIVFYLFRSGILLTATTTGISYWVLIALDPLLQCLVFVTLMYAWRPLELPSRGVQALVRISLLILAAGMSGLAAWYIGPSSHFSAENLAIKGSVFISTLWIVAGLALGISSVAYHQATDHRLTALSRKVVLGFSIYSAASVITEIGHKHFAQMRAVRPYVGLSYMRIVIYLLCLTLWIAACWREPRQTAFQTR